ncbi:MAG: phenylalanine--tRNA ligase beta subunit-related protein, partial [Patescibacteria group bacterium]|nr:phenylalanine--tRNA ligase beta subunit-related protein [Patescibacteria group bacterium]
MKFRLKDIEEFLFSTKLNWLKIVQELNKKSFEATLNKNFLEVDILPNRFADAGNIRGIAKEISIINNLNFKDVKFKIKTQSVKEKFNIEIKTEKCKYYFSRVIFDIENKRSPQWLKDFLKFYGLNSINFLVDLSNYVMIKIGAPLHIFDLDKIYNNKIIIRQAKNGEKFLSLKNKEFILDNTDVVIADGKKILALGGIQGSKFAEVDLKTKNIFIESAGFDNFSIYKTSRRLKLITEASYRFERGTIPKISLIALNYLSYLIEKELKGRVEKKIFSYYSDKKKEKEIVLSVTKVENYYGQKINLDLILKILRKIGCKIIKKDKEKITIKTPEERKDLNYDVDLIEEIIRIIGYEKLNPSYPQQFNYPQENQFLIFKNKIRDFLIQNNFTEVYSYNFIDENDVNNFKSIFDFS